MAPLDNYICNFLNGRDFLNTHLYIFMFRKSLPVPNIEEDLVVLLMYRIGEQGCIHFVLDVP